MEPDNTLLRKIYKLTGPDEARDVYNDWAATYDEDTTAGMGYVAPGLAAQRLVELVDPEATVLDTGCGTGLVGAALAERARGLTVDGVDISPGMLEKAASLGVYRTLSTADLTKPLVAADSAYDAVICVGTLTGGHVGPEAFEEFARVVRPGGVVVATVNSLIWGSGGYPAYLEGMAGRGLVRIKETEERPYHEQEGITCRLCVLEVC